MKKTREKMILLQELIPVAVGLGSVSELLPQEVEVDGVTWKWNQEDEVYVDSDGVTWSDFRESEES